MLSYVIAWLWQVNQKMILTLTASITFWSLQRKGIGESESSSIILVDADTDSDSVPPPDVSNLSIDREETNIGWFNCKFIEKSYINIQITQLDR